MSISRDVQLQASQFSSWKYHFYMKLNRVNSRQPRSIPKKDLEPKNWDAHKCTLSFLIGPSFSHKAEKQENRGRK